MSESKRPSRIPLRLDAVTAMLETKLEDESGVLELLLSEMTRGHQHPELWERVHQAAARDDMLVELAFAYEQLTKGRKFKVVPQSVQVEVLMRAATFYDDVFGDYDGAIGCLERVLALVPAHEQALEKIAPLMRDGAARAKLADFHAAAALHKTSAEEQTALLRRALEIVRSDPDERERAIRFSEALLRLEPSEVELRHELERNYQESGRFVDLSQLLERTLASAALEQSDASALHARLVRLYSVELDEPERAMPHVDELLKIDPANLEARNVAERLLSHKSVAGRAAAALGTAYEQLGEHEKAAEMLAQQLEYVRGSRRMEVRRRLAELRERLGDYASAQSLLELLVTTDPSDDQQRERFIALSRETDKLPDAAKALVRSLSLVKDAAIRARVSADLAKVLLETRDFKRARNVLQELVTARSDDAITLFAARALAELYDTSREAGSLAPVLDLLADTEPDSEARQNAALRLAMLCETELDDRTAAITAWRRLVDSPMREQALRALEGHYAALGADADLASILEARAAGSADSEEAKSAAYRAAEIRASSDSDQNRKLAIWQHLLAVHGPSRAAHERLIPLLRELERWQELASILRDQVVLLREDERPAVLMSLAEVQLNRLGEARSAIDTYSEVLMIDLEHRDARQALEDLLDAGEQRLAAADALEPVYRATFALPELIRVLEARAELDPSDDRRRAVLDEALDLLADQLDQPERAVELATRALARAVADDPERIVHWLTRIERIAAAPAEGPRKIEASSLAAQLVRALGERPIDSPPLARLAQSAAEALAAASQIDRAVALYRQLVLFEPTNERQARLRELVIEHGNAEDRLSLYRATLAEEQNARARRSLFLQIARIQQDELGDPASAITTCERALEESPGDGELEDALAEAYAKAEDPSSVYAVLERSLSRALGERRNSLLLRMGEVSLALGETARALEHYREVIRSADVEPELFDRIEAAAASQKQGDLLHDLYDRRIAQSPDRSERVSWLERLGEVQLERVEDPAAAVSSWKRAARLCEEAPTDPARARALYERVLSAAPDDVETAERLLVLYGENPDPRHMPTVYAALLKSATDERVALERLREFEQHAVRAGALDEFCRTVDLMLSRHMSAAAERAGELLTTKARALSSAPERRAESEAVLACLEASKGEAGAMQAQRQGQSFVLPWSVHELRESRLKQVLETAAAYDAAGDAPAAVDAYRRVLSSDPERSEARYALVRLLPLVGEAQAALELLEQLMAHAPAEIRAALELQVAGLYLNQLDRASDALDILEKRLRSAQADPLTVRLLERAVRFGQVRARAAGLLEQALNAVTDDDRVAGLLEAVLEAPADTPELLSSRSRLYERLLDAQSKNQEAQLAVALRAVGELPAHEPFWQRLDQLARRLNRPESVADAYRKAVAAAENPAQLELIGRRAVDFFEEWYDDPKAVVSVLSRMLLSDSTRWSFDRLKVLFSSAGRWDEFFAVYDQTLERTSDEAARAELLEEAASAARNIAKDADRAIAYYERRAAMADAPPTISALLERLYERSGYTSKLIALLTSRLASAPAERAHSLRGRLAGLWLAEGDEPKCFALVQQILSSDPKNELAFDLIARIVLPDALAPATLPGQFSLLPELGSSPSSIRPTRVLDESQRIRLGRADLRTAATLLHEHYRSGQASERSVAVLQVLLDTADTDAERIVMRRELVQALGALGDRPGIFAQLAQLVRLEANASEHRKAFIALADELGRQSEAVGVLIDAAQACENKGLAARLTFQAATVCRDRVEDIPRAIDLFGQAMELARGDLPFVVASARKLEPLLAAADRHEERCTILERIAELETETLARRTAIAEAARIAAEVLGDRERAIRSWRTQLVHDPADREALDSLIALFEQDRRFAELVEVLGCRAKILDPSLARADRVRIAHIYSSELDDADSAIRAWREVRDQFGADEESFEALAGIFQTLGRWDELAGLLEEQARASESPARKAELYGRLGDLFRERTSQVTKAAESYVAALGVDSDDLTARRGLSALLDRPEVRTRAIDGLARAYVATEDWGRAAELARWLEPADEVPREIARAFWWGVARHERDVRGELEPAEAALIRAHAHDPESFEILETLAQVQSRTPSRALIETLMQLSDARGGDLSLLKQAAEVALRDVGDRRAAEQLLGKALESAIERWTNVEVSMRPGPMASSSGPAVSPAEVAAWALDELVRLGYEQGNPTRVVELLLRGAELPFAVDHLRRMRCDAAHIFAERLNQPAQAIELYRGLLEEEPGDAIAIQSVAPLAELLEQAGEHAELASLWEQQATLRSESDPAASAELWSRAARIAEEQLGDLDRALIAHENAAQLSEDPVSSLEALERIYVAGGDFSSVAGVLERLAAVLGPSRLPPVALRLAETYVTLGDRAAARERLEGLLETTAYEESLCAGLAALYEADQDWTRLAELSAAQAKHASERTQQLVYLRKAADLYLTKSQDRERAIPLLEQALELTHETAPLTLSLADALSALGRLEQARAVLTRQLERYGDRRPKHRALVHFALGRALSAGGDSSAALAELETAARINPTHATILQSLARLAREQGELERARNAYEGLLLLRRKPDEPEPMSRSSILLELAKIADDLDDPLRAEELRESAQAIKKAAAKSDSELAEVDAEFAALESAE